MKSYVVYEEHKHEDEVKRVGRGRGGRAMSRRLSGSGEDEEVERVEPGRGDRAMSRRSSGSGEDEEVERVRRC